MIWMRTSLRFIDQGRGGRGDGCDWWRDGRERTLHLSRREKVETTSYNKKELIVIGDMFEYSRAIASQRHIIIPRHAMPTHQHHA